MHAELLEQGISAETRRAIFLNDKLAEGHPLEKFIQGHWQLVKEADSLDVMLNPTEYRMHLQGLAGTAVRAVETTAAVLPSLKVVAKDKAARSLASSDAFVTRLLRSM